MNENVDVIGTALGAQPEVKQEAQPVVETQQEVKTEAQPEVAQPEVKTEQQIDIDAVVKERTGGKFEKFEDLIKINEVKQPEFKNDLSKQVFELLKEGKVQDVTDILSKQSIFHTVDNLSPEDAIKMKMSLENPEWTSQDIEDEFNTRFKKDEVDMELLNEEEKKQYEKDLKRIERELKKEAKSAKEFLSSKKEDITLPDITPAIDEKGIVDKYLLTQEQEILSARQEYLQTVDSGVDELGEIAIEYKDEEVDFNGKYLVTPEDKQALKQTLKDFQNDPFVNGTRYFKDGKYDTKQLAEDKFWLENKSKIIQSFVSQAVNKTKADFIKNVKNVDFSEGPRQPIKPSADEAYLKMVDAMMG